MLNTQDISAGFEAAVLPAVMLLLTMFRDDPAAQLALQGELETARERIVEAEGSELRLEAFDATAISLLSAISGKVQPAHSNCIH